MRDGTDQVRVVVTLPNGTVEFGAPDEATADKLTGWLAPHVPDTAEWHRVRASDDPQPGDNSVEDPTP